MTRTLTILLALLLASCVEVPVGASEPQGSGNSLPPLTGAADDDDVTDDTTDDDDDAVDDDDSDDDASDDDDATEDNDVTDDDDDITPDDDDDVVDDDDTTPTGDNDGDEDMEVPGVGDVSWWYRSENSVQYDAMAAFAWSWAWQSPGDTDCSDCYVILNLAANAVTISGGVSQQPDLASLPQGTEISFDVVMEDDGEGEIWSCQNGAPSGWLRVWWGGTEQTVCTDDWGAGCSRVVELGAGNCNAF